MLSACATQAPLRERAPITATAEGRCRTARRTVSTPGRSGYRPDIAASSKAYGVVFEDSTETHRAVRFIALDASARPIAASVEVADLVRGGSEPHIAAIDDEFVVRAPMSMSSQVACTCERLA